MAIFNWTRTKLPLPLTLMFNPPRASFLSEYDVQTEKTNL